METKTINGLTFLQFSNALLGYFIIDKKTKQEIFRFELFHSGKTFAYIKENVSHLVVSCGRLKNTIQKYTKLLNLNL